MFDLEELKLIKNNLQNNEDKESKTVVKKVECFIKLNELQNKYVADTNEVKQQLQSLTKED